VWHYLDVVGRIESLLDHSARRAPAAGGEQSSLDAVAQPQQVEAPLEPSHYQIIVNDRAVLHALELGPLDVHQPVKQVVRGRVQPSVVRLLRLARGTHLAVPLQSLNAVRIKE
jgi:hypothetical protein